MPFASLKGYYDLILAQEDGQEVKRQVDPWVGGFGIGARISVFGYFLRFDYAWGVEDWEIPNKKGMFMFSLGTDF